MLLSQEKSLDTVVFKERYGLRMGIDLSKPIRGLVEKEYRGWELVADYRISKRWYVAGELGYESKRVSTEVLDFSTTGTYLRLGPEVNVYQNWAGMENQILVGFRYGVSAHQQNLHAYQVHSRDQYWNEPMVTEGRQIGVYDGLSAHWIEFVLGLKAEVLHNLYMGLSFRLNRLLSQKNPQNFSNLYIPGYHRINEGNSVGVGMNYTLMYQLPLYKKNR